MYASRDVLYIRSHHISTFVRRNRAVRSAFFRPPCKFCENRTTNSESVASITQEGCPVCAGTGILTLEGNRDNYKVCETCRGSGKDPCATPERPCHICKGSGLVKIELELVNNG